MEAVELLSCKKSSIVVNNKDVCLADQGCRGLTKKLGYFKNIWYITTDCAGKGGGFSNR